MDCAHQGSYLWLFLRNTKWLKKTKSGIAKFNLFFVFSDSYSVLDTELSHRFNKILVSAHYVTGAMLGIGVSKGSRIDMIMSLWICKCNEGSEHETTKSCRRKVQGIVRVDVKGTWFKLQRRGTSRKGFQNKETFGWFVFPELLCGKSQHVNISPAFR